jgi:hypothetical protein
MQLRPRDGNGRAITSKDGLIRSFKKIIDRDQLDPMPDVPVKGGQMYYFKTGKDVNGTPLTKIVPYDKEVNKEKKVPKFKSNYTKVQGLVATAAPIGGTPDYDKLLKLRKLYVNTLGAITDKQFERMLKEQGVIEKVEEGDNTTDHADLKNFVEEAITTYRTVHPNRAIDLSDKQYKSYINKVLERVREQYYKAVNSVMTFDASAATKLNKDRGVSYAIGALHNSGTSNAATVLDVSADLVKFDTDAKVNAENKTMKIVPNLDNNTKLVKNDNLKILLPITVWSQEREDLVELIKELYKIFIEQTEQKLKANPEYGFTFSDGGRKGGKSHRRGAARDGRSKKGGKRDGAKRSRK